MAVMSATNCQSQQHLGPQINLWLENNLEGIAMAKLLENLQKGQGMAVESAADLQMTATSTAVAVANLSMVLSSLESDPAG